MSKATMLLCMVGVACADVYWQLIVMNAYLEALKRCKPSVRIVDFMWDETGETMRMQTLGSSCTDFPLSHVRLPCSEPRPANDARFALCVYLGG